MTEQEFANGENWLGSFYELGIAFAPDVDTQQLLSTLLALWQHPLLEGPVLGPYDGDELALTPTTIPLPLEETFRFFGTLRLPQRRTIGCLSIGILPSAGTSEDLAARRMGWVRLCIPVGMLESAYPVEYPIVWDTNPWLDQFERILLDIAEHVFRAVPFDTAVIGEEDTAFLDADGLITPEELAKGGYLVSPRRASQLKPERMSEILPTGLVWFYPPVWGETFRYGIIP